MPNADGSNPGDATTSPFGDGSGSTMAKYGGNNFTNNPAGQSPRPPVNNFLANPSGQGAAPAPTESGEDPDINQSDRAPGPATAAEVATPSGEAVSQRDIGTVAGAAVHKPFRTTGG